MGWCIRQCRPDLEYHPSRLQSVTNAAQVKHLKLCNEVLQELQEFCDAGLTFKGKAFDWDASILATTDDASFAQEQLVIDDENILPHRSQLARMSLITGPELWDGDEPTAHIVSFKSAVINRVCKSTMAAETKAKIAGVAEVHQVRAIITDMHNKLDRVNWETSSAKTRKCLWLTDCEDLASHLHNSVHRQVTEPRIASIWPVFGNCSGKEQMGSTTKP